MSIQHNTAKEFKEYLISNDIKHSENSLIFLSILLKNIEKYSIADYCIDFTDNICSVLLKYDKLTISNSLQESYDIEDLYVKLHFNITTDNKSSFLTNIKGRRMGIKDKEYCYRYPHPHLNDDAYCKFKSFCYAENDVKVIGEFNINKLYISFSNKVIQIKDLKSISLATANYVMLLDIFLEWESLEGGPYHRMCNLFITDYDFVKDFNELASPFKRYKKTDDTMRGFSNSYINVNYALLERFRYMLKVNFKSLKQIEEWFKIEENILNIDIHLIETLVKDFNVYIYFNDNRVIEYIDFQSNATYYRNFKNMIENEADNMCFKNEFIDFNFNDENVETQNNTDEKNPKLKLLNLKFIHDLHVHEKIQNIL